MKILFEFGLILQRAIVLLLLLVCGIASSQNAKITGKISSEGTPVPYVNIFLEGTQIGGTTNENGAYILTEIPSGSYKLTASVMGYATFSAKINLSPEESKIIDIALSPISEQLDETVVTGTLKPVKRLESPVPVEVYSPTFLKKNPTPSIFEALQMSTGLDLRLTVTYAIPVTFISTALKGPIH